MRDREGFAGSAHYYGWRILLGMFCGLALSACAHHVRPMLNDRTIVIPGRSTVGNDLNDATKKTLIAAARLTLDHGFRYFTIVGSPGTNSIRERTLPIQPGAEVTIKVYREGEIDPRSPNVWDAGSVAAGNL